MMTLHDRADETRKTRKATMSNHRTPDGQKSTMEQNTGVDQAWRAAHTPRHAAQETTPMDLPARGAGITDTPAGGTR